MKGFGALLLKEWRLIWRDRLGMLVLFVMPAVLVMVITLVQNTHRTEAGHIHMKLLLVNHDHTPLQQQLLATLKGGDYPFQLVTTMNQRPLTERRAKNLLLQGRYAALLVVPKGLTHDIRQAAKAQAAGKPFVSSKKLQLQFSPQTPLPLALLIKSHIQQLILQANVLGWQMVVKHQQHLSQLKTPLPRATPWLSSHYLGSAPLRPNATQQNVPAWAIFGLFFIVIPLSATLIHERRSSVIQRLWTTPMSASGFLLSKYIAYVLLNIVQLLFVFILGQWILPLLGAPSIDVVNHLPALLVVGLCCALAASAYGLLIGMVAKSFQQASLLGPVLVVIAAAIGGIMVPGYLMPEGLQYWQHYSPLHWGLMAFLQVLVEGRSLLDVWQPLLALLVFAIVALFGAIALLHKEQSQ